MQQKQKNLLYSHKKIVFKEDDKEFYSEGFIATTHEDREGDTLSLNAINSIAEQINNQYNTSAGAASDRHDWLKEGNQNLPLAGRATTAEVRDTGDGHKGVFVNTHHHKFHPDFDEIKYNVEKGYYPGYSIEFTTDDEKDGDNRVINELELHGYGFANQRLIANPHATIEDCGYKEMMGLGSMESKAVHKPKEDAKQFKKKKKIVKGDNKMEKENKEAKAPEEKKEVKEAKEVKEEPKPVEAKEHTVSAEDMALLTKYKETKDKEVKMKEIMESKEFKSAMDTKIKESMVKDSPLLTKDDDGKPVFKEFDDYRAALAEMKELDKPITLSQGSAIGSGVALRKSMHTAIVEKQYKQAGSLYNALEAKGINPHKNGQSSAAETKQVKMDIHGSRMEMKEFHRLNNIEMKGQDNATTAGLQTDTNLASASWSYGSYFLSPVELNDIFQPVLINQLNDQTVTFGRLNKVDWSGRSQIQFRARTGRNSTAGGYTEGANLVYGTDFSGVVGRDKFQQPFAYYRVLVAITGQEQRFGMQPGGMGDVWADEIKWSGEDLLVKLNQEIIGTGDGSSESTALGFEGLMLGTSGTLYGKSLATYATLRSHKEAMSSARITLDQLRKMIRLVSIGDGTGSSQIHSNSNKSDLVFIGPHLQIDFIKGLIQDMQRIVPTSARVGFEGEIEFDGVPIIADKDMNTNDLFLVNVAHTKIGMNLPPTLEPLPVTADAQAAHIKTYFNLYSDAPGNNYWADGLAIS